VNTLPAQERARFVGEWQMDMVGTPYAPAKLWALTPDGKSNFVVDAFTPGLAHDYFASSTATVLSTAGDATLSVADPSGAYAAVGSVPLALKTWAAPTSNEAVTVDFKQPIAANDALRTGTYAKTLTFTLSTTNP
jgi:hypothetical protein